MSMHEKEKPISLEELAISNMWELEALINVLVQKNLITKEELLEEIKELKSDHDKKIN